MAVESPAEKKPESADSQAPAPASDDSGPSAPAGQSGASPRSGVADAARGDAARGDAAQESGDGKPAAEESTATQTIPSDRAAIEDEQTKTETEPAVLKAKRAGKKPPPDAGKRPPRPRRPDLSLGRARKHDEPEADTQRKKAKKLPSEPTPAEPPEADMSRPTAIKRPASMGHVEPDATAATVPYVVDRDSPIGDPLTDEDGPTLIAYRAKKSDHPEESTLVQSSAPATPAPPIAHDAPATERDLPTEQIQVPHHQLFSGLSAGHLAQQLAEREAAVQAALAAATGMAEDAGNRAARYDRMATIGSVAALGVGMFMGALCGYFAAGEAAGGNAGLASAYASLVVLTTIAIFVAGVASLQRSLEMKLAMSAMSALMLLFTFVRLLTVVL